MVELNHVYRESLNLNAGVMLTIKNLDAAASTVGGRLAFLNKLSRYQA